MVQEVQKNLLAHFQVLHSVLNNVSTERKMEKLQMGLLLMLQRKGNVIVNTDKLGELHLHPGKIHTFHVRTIQNILMLSGKYRLQETLNKK